MSIVNYSEVWECVSADVRFNVYDVVEDECLTTVRSAVLFTTRYNPLYALEQLIESKMNEFQY